jgi:hypothetical protein
MASTAADTAGSLTHTHTHTVLYFTAGISSFLPPQEYLKDLRTLLFQRASYNYHAVMYFKKEIIISFL